MRGARISDMTHFLDDSGRIPIGLPPIAKFLGAIVEASSAEESAQPCALPIRCRRRPGRRSCTGVIWAALDHATQSIDWRCSVCEDHGSISRWQSTPWDKRRGSELPGLSDDAARAWQKVPSGHRFRLLNNVFCVSCHGGTSIAVTSGAIERGELVLRGTCTRCGGEVARVIEGAAKS
jgi:hypothetical protein